LAEGLVTDELKEKIAPLNKRFKEIESIRKERKRIRRRKLEAQNDVEAGSSPLRSRAMELPSPSDLDESDTESKIRKREEEELMALVHQDLRDDEGANVTGCYELVGERRTLSLFSYPSIIPYPVFLDS
jgi:ubiquitin carboxyl-terminal hydrolase 14